MTQVLGLLWRGGILGRGSGGRYNAARKRDIRHEQQDAIKPYETISSFVDELIGKLGGFILEADRWLVERKSTPDPDPDPDPIVEETDAHDEPIPKFFFYLNDSVVCPHTTAEIAQLHQDGVLTEGTKCCKDGGDVWKTFAEAFDIGSV